jgi:hypothetical protein
MDTRAPVPSPLPPLGSLEEEEGRKELRRRGKRKKEKKRNIR